MSTLTLVCGAFALMSLLNGSMAVEEERSAEEIRSIFNAADKDGNGQLSIEELKEVTAVVLDVQMDQLDEDQLNSWTSIIMTAVDEDGDGMVNYNELTTIFTAPLDEKKIMKAVFTICDTDADGKLTETEMMEGSEQMNGGVGPSAEDLNKLIVAGDQDGDGKLSFQEFSAL